jgi:hypothetical protein
VRIRVSSAVLALSLVLATEARAQPADEATRNAARVLGEEGLARYDQGEYAAALEKFDKADALYPAPTLRLRAGRSLEKLGRWVEASERWLSTTSMTIDPSLPEAYRIAQAEAQAQAESERAALLPRIPTIEISVAGAAPESVTVDGALVPLALIGSKRPVDPGEHVVRAIRGKVVVEKRIKVAEAEHARVVLEIAEPARPLPAPRPPSQDTSRDGKSPWWTVGWVGVGTGAAGLTVGAVTLGLALDRKAALDDACDLDTHTCVPNDSGVGEDDVDTYNALATTSTVAFVAGSVVGVAGAVILIVEPFISNEASASVEPVLEGSERGIFAGARGRF